MRNYSKLYLFLMILISSNLYAVCMTELDAEIYGCIPMRGEKAAKLECEKKYGEEYKAYYTTNTCSNELAASIRGEKHDPDKELTEVVEAACMSYEQGSKRKCTVYDYIKAEQYCAELYGHKYVPFIIDENNCSKEQASKARGEVNPELLIDGLDSDIEEIEKMMTMLDKEGVNNSLGNIIYQKPNIDTEFYIGITKRIMAKMNMAKEDIFKKSNLKVSVRNPYTKRFLKYIFRYMSLVARLHKLYAFVAHQNHYVLNSYNFENLEYLNLKLRRDFGLEILAKINYRVITVDEGKSLLFQIDETEKQTYEYQAIQDPNSKMDYAKLVSFMGIRSNLVNLWAVQKLSQNEIQNSRVSSCGKGFLTFRPGRSGQMNLSKAMTSLKEYDVFNNDYHLRWNQLIEKSKIANILDENKASNLIYELFNSIPELKSFVEKDSLVQTEDDLKELAKKDAKILTFAEKEGWEFFVDHHFSTIVMPGDNVLDKWKIINRIWRDSFERRVAAIQDAFVGSYVWLDDNTLEKTSIKIRELIEQNYKNQFFEATKKNLSLALTNYNDHKLLSEKYKKEKIESILAIAYTGAQAALIDFNVKKRQRIEGYKSLNPISSEELVTFFNHKIDNEFYDVRYTMERDSKKSKIVDEFFKRVGEIFISETKEVVSKIESLDKLEAAKMLMFKENEFLSTKLREAAVVVAREYFLNYPFEISELDSKDVSQYFMIDPEDSSYRQQIWENKKKLKLDDSKRVDMSQLKLALEALDKKEKERQLKIQEVRDSLFGYQVKAAKGYNKDKLSTGEISRPLKVDAKGIITSPKGLSSIDNNKLIDMYIRSGNLSDLAQSKLRSSKKEIIKYSDQQKKEGKYISDNREFFYRMLESLDLSWIAFISEEESNYVGGFTKTPEDQQIIAIHRLSKAYQLEPILRNEITWTQKESSYEFNGYNYFQSVRTVSYSKPLLEKIALSAFSGKTLEMNLNASRKYIDMAIEGAIKNTPEKLSKFCKANYLKFQSDSNFKDVFNSSPFIRATLKSSVGISEDQALKMNKFDDGIRKDIRSTFEGINEDYLEPSLHILGTAALISLGVILLIGTSGLAAPGIMGTIYSVASTFLAVEFFVSFPLVVGSLYSRLNTHFIEVPAQLKFQKSLAVSQLDHEKVVDWDMLKSAEDDNSINQAWTAGFAPLDFLYGYTLVKHIRNKTGLSAVAAYKRQTGMNLRRWSAPPASMLRNTSFRELRQKHGLLKAGILKSAEVSSNLRLHMPKYQQISEDMIKTAPLRVGYARMAKKLNIHNKPWILLKELKDHTNKLKSRYEVYKQYVADEAKMLERYRLTGRFEYRDLRIHGMQYSAISFIPKSLFYAIKTKRLKSFFRNFGEIWNELKSLQGKLIQERADKLQSVINKLEAFKAQNSYGRYQRVTSSQNLMDDFQRLLTDQELLILEEVSKKSVGYLRHFKKIYNDQKIIIEGLRPVGYLFGHVGEQFGSTLHYPQNILMGETTSSQYTFNNTSEDIVNFYESLLRQNATNAPDLQDVRREVEEQLSRHFIYKPNGERIFFD